MEQNSGIVFTEALIEQIQDEKGKSKVKVTEILGGSVKQ